MTKKKKGTALKYDVFTQLVKDTKHNIIQREVFDKSLKDEVNDFCLELGESTSEFRTVQNLYDSFISKGNSEAFYSKFYGEIVLNSSKYFKGLSQRAATLLATKLADTLLGHAKEGLKKNSAKDVVTTVSLSENELAGMQYLGGYVLQSLHKKHRTSKHKATTESQQAISILTAPLLTMVSPCERNTHDVSSLLANVGESCCSISAQKTTTKQIFFAIC